MSSPFDNLTGSSIHQRVTARLRLPGIAEHPNIPGLDTYSVYKLESGEEGGAAVSRPFSHTITFISDHELAVEALVDTEAQLILNDEQRPLVSKTIHGRIFKAEESGAIARRRLYKIELVSPLRYLDETVASEIFTDKSVPEIVAEVISRYDALLHLALVNKSDAARFPKRHYTTRYQQSALEFITMLCEEEGLVLLVDAFGSDPYTLTLCELNEHAPAIGDTVECHFNQSKTFRASAQVQDYFDTYKPSVDFEVSAGSTMSAGTLTDNPSTSELRTELKRHTLRDRLETYEGSRFKDLNRYKHLDAQKDFSSSLHITGNSGDLNLFEGCRVTLYDPMIDEKVDAIILSVQYEGNFPNALDEYSEEATTELPQYTAAFTAVPAGMIYRPEASVSKPRIKGVLSAIVSGGDSDTASHANEIDVNEHGEIRVIFHFDDKRPTSRYAPLSTGWAGDGYGAQFLPRVNSEVMVSFIGGDPDRPVILGPVHNGDNRQPYDLPTHKTQSFIKTQTTPQYAGEEGYNELRFEDKQGEERLSIRAQKDHSLHVLNDSGVHIRHDSQTTIDHDTEHTVANNRTETVGNDYSLNVKANKITTIEKEDLTTVMGDRDTTLKQNDLAVTKLDKTTIIEQNLYETIKHEALRYTEGDDRRRFLENLYQNVNKELGIEVTGAFYLDAASIKETSASTIEYDAPSGISLKCGGNVLTIDGSGIHFKTPVFDDNSGNGGVSAAKVKRPEYNTATEEHALESTFAYEELKGLTNLMEERPLVTWLAHIFGYDIPLEAYVAFHGDLINDAVTLPEIVVYTSGKDAMYDFDEQTVLVGLRLIDEAKEDNDAAWKLNIALSEEFGHHIDYLLRNVYSDVKGDGFLDEGARYAYNMAHYRPDRQSVTEFARYSGSNGDAALNVEYEGLHKAVSEYLSVTDRADNDLYDGHEHFLCARTAGDRGPGLSFGHESIEDELRFAGFDEIDRIKIFFGNWTRDYNQFIAPVLLKAPNQPPGMGMSPDAKALPGALKRLPDDGLFTRESLTEVIGLLAEIKFINPDNPKLGSVEAQRELFRIDTERLGLYRPEEHQDNPFGLPDGRSKDPDFRAAPTDYDLAVDPATGIRRYIASPGTNSSYDFIERYFSKAIAAGRTDEGLRYFGMGLHILEDFFCHTNMVEISLYKLGYKEVELWATPAATGEVPVTSGVFGFVDTAVSILYEIAHILSQAPDCSHPEERTAAQKMALILLRDTNPEWAGRLEGLMENIEKVQKEYPKVFTTACNVRQSLVGWIDKSIGYAIGKMVALADDLQSFSDEFTNSEHYTHSQMSKDHDDHPLHVLSAKLAKEAAEQMGYIMREAFRGQATIEDVMQKVKLLMSHPQRTTWMDPIVNEWARTHAAEIEKAGDRRELGTLMHKQYKRMREEVTRFHESYDASDNFFENLLRYYGVSE